jgi:hypothetical protein
VEALPLFPTDAPSPRASISAFETFFFLFLFFFFFFFFYFSFFFFSFFFWVLLMKLWPRIKALDLAQKKKETRAN